MVSRYLRHLSLAALAAVVGLALGTEAFAQQRSSNANDLFYNYYAEPGYGGLSAQMYVSPRPTPPLVGHTYISYQPLMPHEFLYPHHRRYVRTNPDGCNTVTSVHWGHRPCLQEGSYLWLQRKHKNAVYPQHF